MKRSLWIFGLGVCLLVATVCLLPYGLLAFGVQNPHFKTFAEEKAGEFLSAKVTVGGVRLGLLNRVSLNELVVESHSEDPIPYQVEIDQIVFRYRFLQLLKQNLKVPADIILKSPKILLGKSDMFYRFFEDLDFETGTKDAGVSMLELQGGKVAFYIPGTDSEVQVDNIEGTISPIGLGNIKVDLKGVVDGFLVGEVHVRGMIDPIHKRHQLEIGLNSVDASGDLSIPLRDINGKIRWTGHDLFFDKIQTTVYGWESTIKGSFQNYYEEPLLMFHWKIGKKYPYLIAALRMDLGKEYVEGSFEPFGKNKHSFQGRIKREGWKFLFDELYGDSHFAGDGVLDLDVGNSHFSFSKGSQRFSVNTNLRDLNFTLKFNLDHANLYGLDLVTSAQIELDPRRPFQEDRLWDFNGIFKTEYFILEYAPFDDFHGTFRVDTFGVHDFESAWGKNFAMSGNMLFASNPPEVKLMLNINEFDLSGVKDFASKPLPKKLGGIVDGKFRIEGNVNKPEVLGDISVKNGTIGRLEYDRMIAHTRGYPPYLPLEDSRILKGRSELYLRGALDLSLNNMFHGVRIETGDQLVLWKGWEVSASDMEGDLEIGHIISKFPMIALKAGFTTGDTPTSENEGVQEESFVAAGPKIRF